MAINFKAARFINPKEPAELEYETVLVAKILPKQGHSMMRKLQGKFGVENLQHLKRVQKIVEDGIAYLHVVLCPSPMQDDRKKEIPQVIQQLIGELNLKPYETQVPKHPPRTKEQWQEWCKVWPIAFRPLDSSMQENLDDISQDQQQEMENFMRKCYELKQDACNAAILVDPASGECVATVVDREQHILHHAVMLAIDAASKLHLLQQQPKNSVIQTDPSPSSSSKISRPLEHKNDESPQRKKLRMEKNLDADNQVQNQFYQNDLVSEIPCCIAQSEELGDQIVCKECGLQQQKCRCQGEIQYLCTGYHCYVIQEPCIMCTMAMVHSRISRVVYAVKDEKFGALGGQLNLMKEQSLNHHYDVYYLQPQD